MTGADPASPWRGFGSRGGELALRVGSALVLVPLAIATAYVGGWPFAVFWGLAALGVLWEWCSLVAGAERRPALMAAAAALMLALTLMVSGLHLAAVIVLALAMSYAASSSAAEMRVVPPPALDEAAATSSREVAVLAGGCFWGVQGVFQHVDGVTAAVSGYAGGAADTDSRPLVGSQPSCTEKTSCSTRPSQNAGNAMPLTAKIRLTWSTQPSL